MFRHPPTAATTCRLTLDAGAVRWFAHELVCNAHAIVFVVVVRDDHDLQRANPINIAVQQHNHEAKRERARMHVRACTLH